MKFQSSAAHPHANGKVANHIGVSVTYCMKVSKEVAGHTLQSLLRMYTVVVPQPY